MGRWKAAPAERGAFRRARMREVRNRVATPSPSPPSIGHRMISNRYLVAFLVAVAGLISAASAQVNLTDVSLVTLQLSGKSYFEVTATMNGPPASPYSVP